MNPHLIDNSELISDCCNVAVGENDACSMCHMVCHPYIICKGCDGRGEIFEDNLISCDICNGEGKIFLEDM